MKAIALIPADLRTTRLGLASRLSHEIAGRSVLAHTVARAAAIPGVEAVMLVHPAGQDPRALTGGTVGGKPVLAFADAGGLDDPHHAWRTASRKWALTAWRGGLGGATCYDELLPAAPPAAALRQCQAQAAVLLGADWVLLDPVLTGQVLRRHLEAPAAMPLTFCQAPPGLAGLALSADLLEQLAQNPAATIGHMLAYVPARPQADPIGKDVCVQVPAAVRSSLHRYVYDTPRSALLIDAIAATLGDRLAEADAEEVVLAAQAAAKNLAGDATFICPQQVTLELTPRRLLTGPIVPQHHQAIERPDMPAEHALALVRRLGSESAGDLALTLGGLGDPLLHPAWKEVVRAAHEAGVFGLAVQTDLLVEPEALSAFFDLPVDVLTVNLNADTSATYQKVTGSDRFGQVIANLEWLLTHRPRVPAPAGRASPTAPEAPSPARVGLPWIVPRLVKTTDTLADMESFFDRWMHFAGHALIEPAATGCGLMPEQFGIRMAPPRRRPCRQVGRRISILSDGRVARCDQDWLGRGQVGAATGLSLPQAAQVLDQLAQDHAAGRYDDLCAACHQWHRP